MKSSRNTVHKSRKVLRLNAMKTVNGDEGSIPFTRSNPVTTRIYAGFFQKVTTRVTTIQSS
jgi:hypothetical protein